MGRALFILVGLLVAGGILVSAAWGSHLHVSSYPATLTGVPEGAKEEGTLSPYTFEEGMSAECWTEGTSGSLSSASGTFSLHPTFSNCVALGFLEASIDTTGCDYYYELGETLGEGSWSAEASLVCEEGKKLTLTAATCEIQIPAQALGTVEVNNASGSIFDDVLIVTDLKGIDYTKTKDGFGCPLKGTGEKSDGTTAGTRTVTGESSSNPYKKTDLYVGSSLLKGSSYPLVLTSGLQGKNPLFSFEEGLTAECPKVHFQGTVSEDSSAFSLTPVFLECSAFGFLEATINVSGCAFEYKLGEKVESNVWDLDLALGCKFEQKIKIAAGTCEVWLIPQEFTGIFQAGNRMSYPFDVSVAYSVEGMRYWKIKDGFGCPLNGIGEMTDGTAYLPLTLTAGSENWLLVED
jgi:hypothetical protein